MDPITCCPCYGGLTIFWKVIYCVKRWKNIKIPGFFVVRENNRMGGAWAQEESVMMLMPKAFIRETTFLGMKGMLRFV